jgi:hypothetical protein
LNELLDSVVLDEIDASVFAANSDLLIQRTHVLVVATTLEITGAYLHSPRVSHTGLAQSERDASTHRIDLCPNVQALDQHALAVEEERVARVSHEQVAPHVAKVVVQQHGVGRSDRALPDLSDPQQRLVRERCVHR